ncbi:hypothetical protein HDU93_008971 [Gonapodya sp. JEL0774]|nr:hypothetical protein HDU93_008971 [Gonapodya sp. JEL0774]
MPTYYLSDLPIEILIRIGEFLPHRLGLPTGTLNRTLLGIFSKPDSIAIRAIAHYPSSAATLVHECSRLEPRQHLVVEAICAQFRAVGGFDVDDGAKLGSPHAETITPLYAAATAGNVEVVRILLNLGADVYERRNTRRLLIRTCGKGHVQVLKLLLENEKNIRNTIPMLLYVSSSDGRVDVVRFPLAEAERMQIAPIDDVQSCLNSAARNGHMNVVHLLLDPGGADVHANEEEVLWTAVMSGHLKIVKLLNNCGSDVRRPSWLRREALAVADRRGATDLLKLVRSHFDNQLEGEA